MAAEARGTPHLDASEHAHGALLLRAQTLQLKVDVLHLLQLFLHFLHKKTG